MTTTTKTKKNMRRSSYLPTLQVQYSQCPNNDKITTLMYPLFCFSPKSLYTPRHPTGKRVRPTSLLSLPGWHLSKSNRAKQTSTVMAIYTIGLKLYIKTTIYICTTHVRPSQTQELATFSTIPESRFQTPTPKQTWKVALRNCSQVPVKGHSFHHCTGKYISSIWNTLISKHVS